MDEMNSHSQTDQPTSGTLSRRGLVALGPAAWLLTACAAPGAGAPVPSSSIDLRQAPAVQLPRSHQLDMRDAVSGHVRRIFVQAPDSPAPAGGYPVLYVLDGNASFAVAAQLARNAGLRPAALRKDPLLVVGIGYPTDGAMDSAARKRDYTPPPAAGDDTGGADLFLDFIEHQLQPALRSAWSLDPRRQTLFGHSLGGLLALHALASRNGLFTRYAAASPSLWWNGTRELQALEAWAALGAPTASADVHLQLRVGALERAGTANADPARAARMAERRMNEHAQALAARLSRPELSHLQVDFEELPGLDHGGTLLPSLIEAMALAQREAM